MEEENQLKSKKLLITLLVIVLIIAGFLDLKFEGLFYKMLPESFQKIISDVLNG